MRRSYFRTVLLLSVFVINSTGKIDAAEKKFSLIIRGGAGSIGIGDMNASIASFNGYYDWLREAYPERNVGGLMEVPRRFKDWEAEVQWAAWKGLGLGIGFSGPVQFCESSSNSYVYSNLNESLYVKAQIRATAPVKLNLHYTFHINSKVNFILNSGVGLYNARMKENDNWLARTMNDTVTVGNYEYNVTGHTTGYHCGFALECKINERFSIMGEGQWRFAKIKSLRGTGTGINSTYENEFDQVSSESTNEEGYLYRFYYNNGYYTFEELEVLTDPSSIGGEVSGLRRAFLDLGGFTFRIGLKIGLF